MVVQRGWHLGGKEYPTRAAMQERNHQDKRALLDRGESHGILVYDAGRAVGWCQFGPAAELPGASPSEKADWCITCFVTDKEHRREGVARAALRGALDAIA